jgi:hypothetical protein
MLVPSSCRHITVGAASTPLSVAALFAPAEEFPSGYAFHRQQCVVSQGDRADDCRIVQDFPHMSRTAFTDELSSHPLNQSSVQPLVSQFLSATERTR